MPARADETVQFSQFMIRAQSEDGTKTGILPISIILDVSDKKRADYVCNMAPRVRDAIVRRLSTETFILAKNGSLMIDGVGDQLRPVISEALQWDVLDAIHVFQGAPKVSSKLAVRLSQAGCARIADDTRPKAHESGGEH